MTEILIGLGGIAFNATALIAFWSWSRSQISKNMAEVEGVKARVIVIEHRCDQRREDFQNVFTELRRQSTSLTRIETKLGCRLPREESKRDREGD